MENVYVINFWKGKKMKLSDSMVSNITLCIFLSVFVFNISKCTIELRKSENQYLIEKMRIEQNCVEK